MGSQGPTMRRFATGILTWKVPAEGYFPLGMVSSVYVDGSELIAGSLCNRLNVYDTVTGALRYTLAGRDGHEKSVSAVLVKAGQIYSASHDMSVKVWTLLD